MLSLNVARTSLSVGAILLTLPLAASSETQTISRPSIYANQAQFDALYKELNPAGLATPLPAAGTVRFDYQYPSSAEYPGDNVASVTLMSSQESGVCNLLVMRTLGTDTFKFYIRAGTNTLKAATVTMRPDTPQSIEFRWNTNATAADSAKLLIAGQAVNWDANTAKACAPSWHQLSIGGGRRDKLINIKIYDDAGSQQTLLSKHDRVDMELLYAGRRLSALATEYVRLLAACPAPGQAAPDLATATRCNVETGERGNILQTAEVLGLAYRLNLGGKRDIYASTARTYAARIVAVIKNDATATAPLPGGVAAAQGRIGALGLIYDWLYDDGNHYADGDGDPKNGTQPNKAIYANAILTEIRKHKTSGGSDSKSEDLGEQICGVNNVVKTTSNSFSCTTEPSIEETTAAGQYSIAESYMAGMNFSTVAEASTALLAIRASAFTVAVEPMLKTLYEHMEKGFLASRRVTAGDGASHQGYGYGMVNIPSRVALWRTAHDSLAIRRKCDETNSCPDGGKVLEVPWLQNAVLPYIYGLRSDNRFPALSDDFDFNLKTGGLAEVFAWAIQEGAPQISLLAHKFYWNHIVPARTGPAAYQMVMERLMWGKTAPELPWDAKDAQEPPLSKFFPSSGRAMMRDRINHTTKLFDYAASTLLEFKSTPFVSYNHHHRDQNSFSLAYKGPLLTDTGVYDEYQSSHWKNYYTRSIAHNTIVVTPDTAEIFKGQDAETIAANDGGQWFTTGQAYAPTTAEVTCPGGSNCLGGIDVASIGPDYSVFRGDASKAYGAKVSAFLRTIAFFPSAIGSRPVAVVFDEVRPGTRPSDMNRRATFLLHTVSRPEFSDTRQVFTTQNAAGGLATVETLLPSNATSALVGGKDQDCIDFASNMKKAGCRYAVRRLGDGELVNYPPKKAPDSEQDASEWRVEITSADPVPATDQHFLHVIGTTDAATRSVITDLAPHAVVVGNDTQSVVVQLTGQGGSKRTVVFKKRNATVDQNNNYTISWTPQAFSAPVLVTGLSRNTMHCKTEKDGKAVVRNGTTGDECSMSDAYGTVTFEE